MKKSYLALGLVAAVAMSSCSNDEPIPGGNQPGVAEGYVPVELGLTSASADVNVGTRGTGTVGGMTTETNKWQYEDIYVLMTSNSQKCLEKIVDAEGNETEQTWGFTSAMGDGPFLKEQFKGEFWARPEAHTSSVLGTNLNYFIDKNEWWNGAPISKYYPMYGASEFFAYYVDDAFDKNNEAAYRHSVLFAGDNAGNSQVAEHSYPIITKENDQMSIQYMIDGTQDLMFGHANNDGEGYSAQTARAGVVPSITMQHLLTRLTFNVIKGAESTNMVRLNGIRVKSKNQGKMFVAYAPGSEPENTLEWNEEAEDATFSLMQNDSKIFLNEDNICLDANSDPIKILANVYVPDVNDTDGDLDFDELVLADAREEREVKYVGEDEDGNLKFSYNDNRFYASIVSGQNVDADDYEAMLAKLTYKAPTPTLENGKSTLVDFVPVYMSTIDAEQIVGEAMFIKPGVSTINMELDLTLTVRKEGETFPGVDEDEYAPSTELEEHLVLPLTINTPANMTFEQGKSYQINVTIYGLEKVKIYVVPEAWENGGEVNIGGDNDAEFGTWFDAEGNELDENGQVVPGENENGNENDPSTGDDTEDDENDPENDPSNDDNTEENPLEPEE